MKKPQADPDPGGRPSALTREGGKEVQKNEQIEKEIREVESKRQTGQSEAQWEYIQVDLTKYICI